MTLNVPDEYLPLIVKALDHYHAYLVATQREDRRYQDAADWFKRKRTPESETAPVRSTKRKR